MNAVDRVAHLLGREKIALEWAQSPLLLLIRLYWGWSFATNGWGKLHHIDQIAEWFGNDLHIPMPLLNAYVAASTELIGGICLFLGLGGRVMTIPLVFTMCVAYATSDKGAFESFYLSEDACRASQTCVEFVDATPFHFLFASLLVLVFGPGTFSVDQLIANAWNARTKGATTRAS
jgi:putative oxidoreductase